MSPPLVHLALIGCGRAAQRLHLPALLASKEAQLVAVVDTHAERRAALAAEVPRCQAFDSVDELLHSVRVDGVIVATPVPTHTVVARCVLRADVPVLMEKPLAACLADAQSLEDDLRSSRGWVMMAFNRRHWAPAIQLRRIVREGHVNDVASVDAILRIDPHDWGPLEECSDALDDVCCHQLDLLRYVFGREIQTVSARWLGETEIEVEVAFEGGMVARCVAGHGAPFREETVVHFHDVTYTVRVGSKYVDRRGAWRWRTAVDGWSQRVRTILGPTLSSYDRQLAAFCAALRADRAPSPDVADGMAVLRAVEAARRSAADGGRKVTV